jgi:hypothetical protein
MQVFQNLFLKFYSKFPYLSPYNFSINFTALFFNNKNQDFKIRNLELYGKDAACEHSGTWEEINLSEKSTIFYHQLLFGEIFTNKNIFQKVKIRKMNTSSKRRNKQNFHFIYVMKQSFKPWVK